MLTNERKEKISAFLDDDMHRDELMSFSLSGEDQDAEVARRYLMMGDALRGEVSDSSFVDVSAAVREALSEEETYSVSRNVDSPVSPANQNRGLFGLSSWFRPAAGMAVAASVAAVMVFTLSEQPVSDSPLAGSQLAGSQLASPQTKDNTGLVNEQSIQLAVDNKTQNDAVQQDIAVIKQPSHGIQRVNPYLVNHPLEYATQDTLQGRLPLVRAVSYESDK